jgi:hypothetical protein
VGSAIAALHFGAAHVLAKYNGNGALSCPVVFQILLQVWAFERFPTLTQLIPTQDQTNKLVLSMRLRDHTTSCDSPERTIFVFMDHLIFIV